LSSLQAEHVVIGWNETREARRAVLDALPFLDDPDMERASKGRDRALPGGKASMFNLSQGVTFHLLQTSKAAAFGINR